MINTKSSTQGNIIPVARKRGHNTNHPHGAKQMNYMNSGNGTASLQEGELTKSPALNAGAKMSNSSLQGGLNRTSMPREKGQLNTQGARTTTGWMQKQMPMSPSRNSNDPDGRIRAEIADGMNSSQHSSYAAQAHHNMRQQIQSPDSLKINDSTGEIINVGKRVAS